MSFLSDFLILIKRKFSFCCCFVLQLLEGDWGEKEGDPSLFPFALFSLPSLIPFLHLPHMQRLICVGTKLAVMSSKSAKEQKSKKRKCRKVHVLINLSSVCEVKVFNKVKERLRL